jgi:oligosaccharide 4-alpha-D-glucosyltransferase
MPYRTLLSLLFIFITSIGSAQTSHLKTAAGNWKIIPYSSNVVKLVYQPAGYSSNENISAAVIGKPVSQASVPVRLVADTLLVGKNKPLRIKEMLQKEGFNGFSITLKEGERIFGGGSRALPLNRRGYRFPLYNNPWYGYSNGADALNFSVPFFTSSDGYALFFDNVSKGYADIGKTDSRVFEVGFVSGELNVYIIFGKTYKDILASYCKLTGTQPLPPRWAMGNFMSRFGYTSEDNVKEIAAKMKQEQIPFDAIIYDLFWFGDSIKGTMGNLDWVNKTKWPNPQKMIGGFKKDDVNTVLIAEPFILQHTKKYEAAKKYLAVDSAGKPFTLTDFYFGQGGLLDIFRKDAGNWIWNNHYKKQLANGVTGWWTDLGEPEKHPATLQHNLQSLGIKRLMGADEVHNAYGHYWNKMLFENYKRELPNERLFHLNRSGFAGSQRFSIFPWSGDVSRSWNGLQAQLPLMLGMSMSGIPYIHADAGGFAGGEGDNELYLRWLQFAAFTPIFRPHGTALFGIDPNTFNFPSEPALMDTPYRSFAKNTVDLRYLMLPYNYTLAYRQASKGEPLVAPLYYYFPADTTAINISDEYLWGENLLVAPVIEKGSAKRRVYLPAGNWYSFFDSTEHVGGAWFDTPVELTHIPVFVKEGSFIPVWSAPNAIHTTAEFDVSNTQIIYFPSAGKTTGMLYNDDGRSKNSTPEVISFTAITKNNTMIIDVKTSNPALYNAGKKKKLRIGSPRKINVETAESSGIGLLNGKRLEIKDVVKMQYHFNQQRVYEFIQFEFNGKPVHLEINLFENQSK